MNSFYTNKLGIIKMGKRGEKVRILKRMPVKKIKSNELYKKTHIKTPRRRFET